MPDNANSPVPQFATAEYVSQAGSATCKTCGRALGSSHYRVNGVVTCSQCAERIRQRLPEDSPAAFLRGIAFGVAGGIVGLILYVAFALGTGLVIGFVALAVGYIVGKAIVIGSKGQGGRRYQLAAVLLTYVAVSLSAIPMALYQHAAQSGLPSLNMARFGELVLLGLASPFLDLSDLTHGVIGLIILFVGIRIAWRMTAGKPVNIVGPLTDPAAVASG
ncbi:MAG TPA: hypothetical protein VIY90_13870 [Steroidobacteraceae bacterium]